MYRVLAASNQVRERRDRRRHPVHTKPVLVARAPNQVWSWDITKLAGPAKGVWFMLYVVLDIFSRYVVGWLLSERENAEQAQHLLRETMRKHGIEPGQLAVHQDRGPPMRAKSTMQLLDDLGASRSYSRPRVCNDNPYSESHFGTLKQRPELPDRLGSLQHGRQVLGPMLNWYNDEHHHSGIVMLTPAQVHFGQAAAVLAQRHAVKMAAYHAHPERFINGPPKLERLPPEVWINPPNDDLGTEAGPD
ncbi:MAG TPA: DDE-type integrase/transposase/recombinase [Candidatus Tectomicrobia bacterium]